MSKLSLFVAAAAALVATSNGAFAGSSGSAADTAYSLGATASPGYAGGRTMPVVSQAAEQSLVTGSVSQRPRAWSRLRHR